MVKPAFSAPTEPNDRWAASRSALLRVSCSPARTVIAIPVHYSGLNRAQALLETVIRSNSLLRSRPALLTPVAPIRVPPNHIADPRSWTACATAWLSVWGMCFLHICGNHAAPYPADRPANPTPGGEPAAVSRPTASRPLTVCG